MRVTSSNAGIEHVGAHFSADFHHGAAAQHPAGVDRFFFGIAGAVNQRIVNGDDLAGDFDGMRDVNEVVFEDTREAFGNAGFPIAGGAVEHDRSAGHQGGAEFADHIVGQHQVVHGGFEGIRAEVETDRLHGNRLVIIRQRDGRRPGIVAFLERHFRHGAAPVAERNFVIVADHGAGIAELLPSADGGTWRG